MKRTNIYLDDEQLRLLKHIAVEEGSSFTELVRKALQQFLESYVERANGSSGDENWNQRMERLLTRVHERTPMISPDEVEADVTAASEELRRDKAHAPRFRWHQRLGISAYQPKWSSRSRSRSTQNWQIRPHFE